MRRIITILLTLILALSMCACSTGKGKAAATDSDLTGEEIQRILEEMEAEEAAQQ